MSPSIVFEKAGEISVNAPKLQTVYVKLNVSLTGGKDCHGKFKDCTKNLIRNLRPGRSVLVSLFPLFKPRRRKNDRGFWLMLMVASSKKSWSHDNEFFLVTIKIFIHI